MNARLSGFGQNVVHENRGLFVDFSARQTWRLL